MEGFLEKRGLELGIRRGIEFKQKRSWKIILGTKVGMSVD